MNSQSLVRRAVFLVLLAESLCAVALSCAATLYESRTRLRAFDATLVGRSDSLLGAIQDAEDPADNVAIDPRELRLPPADVWAVYGDGGRLIGASQPAPDAPIAEGTDGFQDRRFDRHRYRALQRKGLRIIDRGENGGVGLRRPVTIVYASPTDHLWHEVFTAAGFYAAVSLCLLCLTAGFLIWLLRRLLEPLGALAIEASAVNRRSLRFDPPAAAMRVRELRPLAEALSSAIARVRGSFEREQRFLSDAAHELKTAVAVVRSSVQVLGLRPRTDEEYRQGLERVLTDNTRVEVLLARMLTLARLEEGAAAPVPQAAGKADDLRRAVERTTEWMESYAAGYGVELRSQLATGLCAPISGEHAETLVSNLLVNAVQHSPRGGVVRIVLAPGPGNTDVMMAVEDQGTGISAEALPHVFERFFREDTSRSRETGGAGLGLAICKSIVETAGGVIEIQSAAGVGTAVRVIFSRA